MAMLGALSNSQFHVHGKTVEAAGHLSEVMSEKQFMIWGEPAV
jgi:hypothetical protein